MNASAAERLELRTAPSEFVNVRNTTQNTNMKTFQLHCKYVYQLEGRDFVTASPLDKTEFRINVSKTSGESTMFESERTRKRNLLKIQWGYVARMAAPKRHVRQTIRIVDATQRCAI